MNLNLLVLFCAGVALINAPVAHVPYLEKEALQRRKMVQKKSMIEDSPVFEKLSSIYGVYLIYCITCIVSDMVTVEGKKGALVNVTNGSTKEDKRSKSRSISRSRKKRSVN